MRDEQSVIRNWIAGLDAMGTFAKVACIQQGWGKLQFGRCIEGWPLKLAGRTYSRGLGAHSVSEILVRTSAPARRFQALAGQDDNPGTRSIDNRMVFTVEVGGRERWHSKPLAVSEPPARVDVPLHGATAFTLKAWEHRGNLAYAHANWVEPRVTLQDGTVLRIGTPGQPFAPMPPFSFRYGGRESNDVLSSWDRRRKTTRRKDGARLHRLTFRDAKTALDCELELQEFSDFPAAEWLVRFRNSGRKDTPILEDVQALQLFWMATGDPVLRYSLGSTAEANDFLPQEIALSQVPVVRLAPEGGRSSSGCLPFFNVIGDGEGFVTAVGWSGQWAAEFRYDPARGLSALAGMEKTHLKLHPGEEIRTPRHLLLYWKGEALRGHNLLRQFILHHHTRRPDGKTVPAPLSFSTWGGMKTEAHLDRIRTIRKHALKYDYYWVDAGWYGTGQRYMPVEEGSDWGMQVGNWNPNPLMHPRGMKPIGDAARAAGMKFLLWVEPERAIAGTPVTVEHPEWFLGERKPGHGLLLNLGIPAARQWATDLISDLVRNTGVGGYRQDANMAPLPFWRAADNPDRQGITEIRHVEGLYAFWDELIRRHPGLLIDNCASGGRRLDLETAGRSIPLHRTDYGGNPRKTPIGPQTHTFGLSHWLPCSAAGTYRPGDTYNFRSFFSTGMACPVCVGHEPMDARFPWRWYRRMIANLRRAIPCYLGDLYPLTPCTTSPRDWLAYQMHRPDLDTGMILAFRREEAEFVAADFRLRGLSEKKTYLIEDADTGKSRKMSAEELSTRGLHVATQGPRESRLIFYRRRR